MKMSSQHVLSNSLTVTDCLQMIIYCIKIKIKIKLKESINIQLNNNGLNVLKSFCHKYWYCSTYLQYNK